VGLEGGAFRLYCKLFVCDLIGLWLVALSSREGDDGIGGSVCLALPPR
jgi:hypothetical protein